MTGEDATTETTQRSESFPTCHLGINAKSEPIPGENGKSFAKFQIPGKLQIAPRKDSKNFRGNPREWDW